MVTRNRAVEVLHNARTEEDPDWSVGSGYLIGGRLVLTAAHNVGPGECLVRMGDGSEHPALVRKRAERAHLDLAVLELTGRDSPHVRDVVRYAVVSQERAELLERCTGLGFPRFKEDSTRSRAKTGQALRNIEQLDGEIPTASGALARLLTFRVTARPSDPLLPSRKGEFETSPWQGISGTVVFTHDEGFGERAVGVVTEHHPAEGGSALILVPIGAIGAAGVLPVEEQLAWWKLLDVSDPAALPEIPALSLRRRPQPPSPPARAVARKQLLASTLAALRDGLAPLVALTGRPGFGKSVLARLVAAAVDAQAGSGSIDERWCPGGVVWLDVGQDPDLSGLMAERLTDLTGQRAEGRSVEQIASDLGREIAARGCLLVLDDVWPPLTSRADVIGLVLARIKDVPRLVTTRSTAFLDAELSVRRIDIEEMDPPEAAALLATALPAQSIDNQEQLDEFARRLGRWPLLLGLAAAHLRRQILGGVSLSDAIRHLATRFNAQGVTAFDQRHADLLDPSDPLQRDRAVAAAIEASLRQLTSDDQARYRELAVFPPGQPIPVAEVADLWAPSLEPYESDDLLGTLADLSLLSLELGTRQVRVHDLLRDYLLPAGAQPLATLHRQLLDRWGQPLQLEGSYRVRWYAYHLDISGDSDRLYRLVSPAWRDRVLAITGALSDAAADVLRTAEHAARHDNLAEELRCRLILTTTSAHVLALPVALLGSLARTGRMDRALGYAEVLPPAERRTAFRQIATALADEAPEQALEIAERIDDVYQGNQTLGGIAAALIATNAELALDIASRIGDYETKMRTLRDLATALTTTNPRLALAAADRIDDSGDRDQILYSLIDNLAGSHCDMALAAADRIASRGGRAQRLAVIAAAMASDDPDHAHRLTDRAVDIANTIEDAEEKVAALGGIASQLAKTDPDRTLAIVDSMDDSWWKQITLAEIVAELAETDSSRALTAADRLEAFGKAEALIVIAAAMAVHDQSRAKSLVDQALVIADGIRDASEKARLGAAIAPLLIGINPELAWAVVDRIDNANFSAIALRHIAPKLVPTNPELALEVAVRIGDRWNRASALAELAAILVGTNPQLTLVAVKRIDMDRIWLKTLITIAPVLAKADPDGLLELVDGLENEYGKQEALAAIAPAFASVDLNRLIAAAHGIHYASWRASALAGIAGALARTEPDMALVVIDHIDDLVYKVQALAQVAVALAQTNPIRSTELIDRALEVANRLGHPHGKSPALFGMAGALARTEPDMALVVTDHIDDLFYKVQALAQVAVALAQTNPIRSTELIDRALEVADAISERYYNVRALISIVQILAESYPSRAEAVADRIQLAWAKARAIADIAVAMVENDPRRAGALAVRALTITNQMESSELAYKIGPLAKVAAALHPTDPSRAITLFNEALTAADDLHPTVGDRSGPTRAQVLSDIAMSLAATNPCGAEATANRIGDPIECAQTLVRVAVALARTDIGRARRLVDLALTAAERTNDPAGEAQALGEIVATLTTNATESRGDLLRHLDAVIGAGTHNGYLRDLNIRLRAANLTVSSDAWWMFAEVLVIREYASGSNDLLQRVLSAAEW